VYYLGRLDLQDGKLDGAISRFSRIASHPPFPDTSYYLGLAYFKHGQPQEALIWLTKASEASPHDPRAQTYLGRVYHQLGRESESEQAIAAAEAMRKADAEATEQGVACDNDLRTKPLPAATQTCGVLYDVHDAEKLDLLGRLYGQHGMYDLGLEPLKIAVALDPDSYEIQHNLGLTYFRLGKFQEAVGPLEVAVKLRPEFFGSNAVLGASLLAVGEPAQSLAPLRQAHHSHPDDQEVAHMLYSASTAVARDLLKEQKYSECVPVLQEAAAISPNQPEAHLLLAEAFSHLGRNEEAAKEKEAAQHLSGSGS
jgi:Flp pilus assembly protein TadD